MADDATPTRFAIPEFTRSLRGFASVKALGTKEHELIFGPLLSARRSAARVQSPEGRAAAFDADRLRRTLRDAIAAIAKSRSGGNESLQRALDARLEERAGAAFEALDRVGAAAAALKGGAGDKPAQWQAWCDAVQALFNATDGFWLAIDETAPPAPGMARLVVALIVAGALMASASSLQAQRRVLRVEGARADSLVAAGFDVIGADRGAVLIVATPEFRARLDARGLRSSEVNVAGARLADQVAPPPRVYRSYDDPARGIRWWVDSLVAANPRVSVDTIGRSFENRPMFMLKVGPRDDSPQRPNVIIVATHHAREWAATEMAQRLVKWLAAPPGTDARRDSLVQTRDIWIMPVANPDGYQFTFTNDRLWRKTRSPQQLGGRGVDMNRNHSVNWGLDDQGSSSDPRSDVFRGPTPASEIEVRNIEAFHAAHPPIVALSYHTYAGLLIHAPGAIYGQLPADAPVYRALTGTHMRSAVTDRLPASTRAQYAPGPGWMLYTTNGEYTDFASARFGALAFTTELTSGTGPAGFYGFEFPDDDTLLERLFQDNLPFALDLLDAARDPANFRSVNTGLGVDRIVLESVSPDVRVTVPASSAPSATISSAFPLTYRVDSTNGGKFTRRLITSASGRPSAITVAAGGMSAAFKVLSFSGLESSDPAWTMQGGWIRDTVITHSGLAAWMGASGTLTSPAVTVPTDADTVSLAYWTMHLGSAFTPEPSGSIEATTDGGTTWSRVLIQRSSAPAWYTDRATVGGVRGKTVRFRFVSNGMVWRVDDAAIVSHGPVTSSTVAAVAAIRPSENPVRSTAVRFTWPFGTSPGELTALDFGGRIVWRKKIAAGEPATWDVGSDKVANGVYVVVARAAGKVSRLKLFVARGAQ
jgi:hypothetical protein